MHNYSETTLIPCFIFTDHLIKPIKHGKTPKNQGQFVLFHYLKWHTIETLLFQCTSKLWRSRHDSTADSWQIRYAKKRQKSPTTKRTTCRLKPKHPYISDASVTYWRAFLIDVMVLRVSKILVKVGPIQIQPLIPPSIQVPTDRPSRSLGKKHCSFFMFFHED